MGQHLMLQEERNPYFQVPGDLYTQPTAQAVNKTPLKLHSTHKGSSYLHSLKKWPLDFQSLTA